MKVSLQSDLHLEFSKMPPMPGGETLLLSGDIVPAVLTLKNRTDKASTTRHKRINEFFTDCSEKYEKIFFIMGNHEHYSGDFDHTAFILKQFFESYPKITFLNKGCVPLTEKTMIFGGTLWTDMNKGNPITKIWVQRGMNDFCGAITRNLTGSDKPAMVKFTTDDAIKEHEHTLINLKKALEDHSDKNFLVMTHHTPSWQSIHPRYGMDEMNYGYSSDLSYIMLDYPNIKHWVHGHTHDSFDYMIGETRVMCNPRGYVQSSDLTKCENLKFDINFSFEVE